MAVEDDDLAKLSEALGVAGFEITSIDEEYNRILAITIAALLRINELKGVPLDSPVVFTDEDLGEMQAHGLGLRPRPLDTGKGLSFQIVERDDSVSDA